MLNYLDQLVQETQNNVNYLKDEIRNNKMHPLRNCFYKSSNITSFKKFLSKNEPRVIAEIKRMSPSKGNIAKIDNPVTLASQYISGGADALSVLTNKNGFGGSLKDLVKIRELTHHTGIPILRKDFIIDPVQIVESAYFGASAILIIVKITQQKTANLIKAAHSCNLDAIVEVHDTNEAVIAIEAGAEIIAVNNRNLNNFNTDPSTAVKLLPHIPKKLMRIVASGIATPGDAKHYLSLGYHAVLIGEALVKSVDPKKFIQEIKHVSH